MTMRSVIVIVIGIAACGGRQRQATEEAQDFTCKDRLVSYVVSHHMGGDEVGVQMDCGKGPAIKRWKTDKQGTRIDGASSSSSLRASASSGETICSSKFSPAKRASSQPRSDQDE